MPYIYHGVATNVDSMPNAWIWLDNVANLKAWREYNNIGMQANQVVSALNHDSRVEVDEDRNNNLGLLKGANCREIH